MSNQSNSQNSDAERTNHLQSAPTPFSQASPHQLAQFSAATASNYYPKAQAKPFTSGSGFNTTNTSNQTKPTTATTTTTTTTTTKPLSAFAASAYETAGRSGLQPPPAQEIDLNTFKGLKFVTLDGLLIETRDIYDKISGTFQWEMCASEEDHCTSFIRENCANKRVFLISSGSLGRKIVPLIHNLPQIYCVYIFCEDVVRNREWANNYNKVRVVCNDDDRDLLPQLAVDVAHANMEWGDALVKQGTIDKAKKNYERAYENLTKYAKDPDPTMVSEVKKKLDGCK